jgi:hypothetical protein
MSATILRFPGYLPDDDRGGYWKDVQFHSTVDELMESLPEPERRRLLDWNLRRYPEIVAKSAGGAGNAA